MRRSSNSPARADSAPPPRTGISAPALSALRRTHAQDPCAGPMRRTHAQSSCAGPMRRTHAQDPCAELMRRAHAQGSCAGLMRSAHAQGSCAGLVRRARAQGSCAGLMRRAHAQGSCARLMRRGSCGRVIRGSQTCPLAGPRDAQLTPRRQVDFRSECDVGVIGVAAGNTASSASVPAALFRGACRRRRPS